MPTRLRRLSERKVKPFTESARLSNAPKGLPAAWFFDVLSAVNDGDSLLCQQLAPLITSVDSCC